MAIRTTKQWYFDEKDKEQIKSYSEKISRIFKIRGYNPEYDDFEDYFESLEDFDFIPCIREALDNSDDDLQDVMDCLDSVYDPSVSISLEWLEEYAKKNTTTVRRIMEGLTGCYDATISNLLDFIFSCGSDVKQNFIDFLTK